MTSLLQSGDIVYSADKQVRYTVMAFHGESAAGELYQVGTDSSEFLLCLFQERTYVERIKTLVSIQRPKIEFVWPIKIVINESESEIGTLFELPKSEQKSLIQYLKREVNPTFYTLITICINICFALRDLHEKQLYYHILSLDDVHFHSETATIQFGSIKGCLAMDGNLPPGKPTLLGSPRFMAPEKVGGESSSIETAELHSLATLLFYILFSGHPLEGKVQYRHPPTDQTVITRLYGTDPIFIFDPTNKTNTPVEGFHDNQILFWEKVYPLSLRSPFIRTFTEGLKTPEKRVKVKEWLDTLIHLRDNIFYCSHCRRENFYDSERLRQNSGHVPLCWKCGNEPRLPPRIRLTDDLSDEVVMINHDTHLYPHHLSSKNGKERYNFSEPAIGILIKKGDNGGWFLRNDSGFPWKVTIPPQNEPRSLQIGGVVPLKTGVIINFGERTGEIRI